MDSYVFKTSNGATGCFQKNDDVCYLYLDTTFWQVNKSFNWDSWVQHSAKYAHTLPETVLTDPVSKAVSYFIWQCHNEEVNPNIVELEKSIFQPGIYCKRINRNSAGLFEVCRRGHSTIDEVRSYNNLMSSLNAIFNVIEPDKINENVYGHRIRETLTIACTEVEYLLLQILKNNGYDSRRYTTNDYVKVLPVLKLNEYSVELKMHPSMGIFSPFSDWTASTPTDSLIWYASYNAAKHDRGGNFHKATLGATINAIAAVHILLEAQYGAKLFESFYSDYESCFQTRKCPTWTAGEIFAPLIEENEKISWTGTCDFFTQHNV
jgi:hypothetical protein